MAIPYQITVASDAGGSSKKPKAPLNQGPTAPSQTSSTNPMGFPIDPGGPDAAWYGKGAAPPVYDPTIGQTTYTPSGDYRTYQTPGKGYYTIDVSPTPSGGSPASPPAGAPPQTAVPQDTRVGEAQQAASMGDWQTTASWIANSARAMYSQSSGDAETQALILNSMNSMLAMIDQLESRILGELRAMGTADDPAITHALELLRGQFEETRNEMLEDMAARGLAQSGILAEMDVRLQRNLLNEQQRVVYDRLSEIQNQIANAMMSFAQQRLGIQQWGAGLMVESRNQSLNRQLQAQTAALGAMSGIAGLQQADSQFGRSLAFQQQELAARQAMNAADIASRERLAQAQLAAQERQHRENMLYDMFLNEQARRDAQAAISQFGPQDLQAMSSYLETQFGVPMRSGDMTLDQAKQRLRAQAALMNLQPSQLNALMFLLEQMAPVQGPQQGYFQRHATPDPVLWMGQTVPRHVVPGQR